MGHTMQPIMRTRVIKQPDNYVSLWLAYAYLKDPKCGDKG